MSLLASVTATLAITVWPQGVGGPKVERVVRCPGPAYCSMVTRPALAPVPADAVCTQIYGGPQQALVVGRVDGRKVWVRFKRTDGCQIARWDRLAFLFRT